MGRPLTNASASVLRTLATMVLRRVSAMPRKERLKSPICEQCVRCMQGKKRSQISRAGEARSPPRTTDRSNGR